MTPIRLPALPYRTVIMAALGGIVGLMMVAVFFLWQTYSRISVARQPQTISATSSAQLESTGPRPLNFLLLGYGGGTHEGGKLTDTIMVAHVDPEKQRITLVSLPRDLWVAFPVKGEEESAWKINAAYQIGSDDRDYPHKLALYSGEAGGGNLAKYAASKVTGLPLDYFVAVSFAGFTKSVNVLKGIEVQVEKTFDDYWYPVEGLENETCGKSEEDIAALTATMSGYLLEQEFPCRYEHLHFDRGLTTMDGETALKYARSRHSSQDGSDFARSERQKQVILAMKDQVLRLDFLPKLVPFIATLSQDIRTDLTPEIIQDFIQKKDEYSQYEIRSIALTDQNVLQHGRSANGQYILIPREGEGNWSGIHQWLQQQFDSDSPQATSAAQESL